MSRLAVIIPLYNHAAFIEAALASVAAQTLSAQRIIVIDDGSTDDSFTVAQRVAESGTEVFQQENRGAHYAINRGIELAADCEMVAILNSDDIWDARRLERCVSHLQQNPSRKVVCTGLYLLDSLGQYLPSDSPKVRRNRRVWDLVAKENNPLLSLAISNFAKTTSNLVVERKFALERPFQDYRYVHDYHFLLQAALLDRLAIIPDDLLGYRVHSTNTIKADGRRAVVAETVQMHLDLLGQLATGLSDSEILRRRLREYLQRLFGNYTDFRAELFLQVLATAVQTNPANFRINDLGGFSEFESKSEPIPVA